MKRWLWIFWCALAACAGTETGNPSFTGSLGYDAFSSEPSVVALGAALTSPTGAAEPEARVEAAWLVLGDVRFVAQSHCTEPARGSEHVAGLGAGDHVGTQAPKSEFALEGGRYCGLRLPLQPAKRAPDAAPELAGRSLLVTGVLRDGRSFSIASELQIELFLRAAGQGFELDATQSAVVIGFDLATWIELDWSRVPDAAPIVIDPAHNEALLRDFEQRVTTGVKLFRDRDRDGTLDADPELIAD